MTFLDAAPSKPKHDVRPDAMWFWCDHCDQWVKELVILPPFRDQDGNAYVPHRVMCLCCLFRQTGVHVSDSKLYDCLSREECPANCQDAELIERLAQLAGLSENAGGCSRKPFPLEGARAGVAARRWTRPASSCPETSTG